MGKWLSTRIIVVQNMDKWRTLVDTIKTIDFLKRAGISWIADELLPPQEGLCRMSQLIHFLE